MPHGCKEVLSKTTHCLITHKHPDHIDKAALKFLIDKKIPVTCSVKDKKFFLRKGLNIAQTVSYWEQTSFLGGTIEGIPARHGYGFVAKPMGNVMGYYIVLPNKKSIYLSSDTIYTGSVDKVLNTYKPDIGVVACGTAQFDLFKPLLMTMEDIIRFVKHSPGNVIANHLEAVNHCPTTRKQLRTELKNHGLLDKVFIPNDGETINIE